MDHPTGHDALSVSMFWAGALMVFAPLAYVGIVVFVWRRWRRRMDRDAGQPSASDSAQAPGATTRPR